MSDVMLINPSSKEILNNAGDRPPLGLLYLASVLRNEGHFVRVRDMDHYDVAYLQDEIKERTPEFAGVSVYTSPIYPEAIRLARFLRQYTTTIAGGYHATAKPETLVNYFNYVVVGEGELSLSEILKGKHSEGVVNGTKMDIQQVPHPARDLINMKDYGFKQDGKKVHYYSAIKNQNYKDKGSNAYWLDEDGKPHKNHSWQVDALEEISKSNTTILILTKSYTRGHNLQDFKRTIHLDRNTFNNEQIKQRDGRNWRTGSDEMVVSYTPDVILNKNARKFVDIDQIKKSILDIEDYLFNVVIRESFAYKPERDDYILNEEFEGTSKYFYDNRLKDQEKLLKQIKRSEKKAASETVNSVGFDPEIQEYDKLMILKKNFTKKNLAYLLFPDYEEIEGRR